jgi:hypothetical protein
MSWTINYSLENKIIELEYINIVTPDELQSAFEATVKLSMQNKTFSVLADCRKLTGGHTLFDLLNLVEQVENVDFLRLFKEAVILPPGQIPADKVEFWKTACTNRGLEVKIFEDTEEAKSWLKIKK